MPVKSKEMVGCCGLLGDADTAIELYCPIRLRAVLRSSSPSLANMFYMIGAVESATDSESWFLTPLDFYCAHVALARRLKDVEPSLRRAMDNFRQLVYFPSDTKLSAVMVKLMTEWRINYARAEPYETPELALMKAVAAKESKA